MAKHFGRLVMRWHRLCAKDRETICELLQRRRVDAMFMLDNLRRYGFAEAYATPPNRAMSFWRRGDALIGCSFEGMVFPLGDNETNWEGLQDLLHAINVMGVVGPRQSVRPFLQQTGLGRWACTYDQDQPQYALNLDQAKVPEGDIVLSKITPSFMPIATRMRLGYIRETIMAQAEDDAEAAQEDIKDYAKNDTHRLGMLHGSPVMMTGFNAIYQDTAQVGGVYTTPKYRRRGFAARGLALHLLQARRAGITKATLFAASTQAARVYERIGFRRSGNIAIVIFAKEPA